MAILTPAELKTFFETGDFPTQSQFADLIDSTVNTLITGEVSVDSTNTATLSNDAVIEKTLTAYTPSAGTISSADTILSAIEKLDGNMQASIDNPLLPTINVPFVAVATLQSTHGGKLLELDSAHVSPTFGISNDAFYDHPVGTQVALVMSGSGGNISIAPEAPVTILSAGGLLTMNGINSGVTLVKTAANTWRMFGNLI